MQKSVAALEQEETEQRFNSKLSLSCSEFCCLKTEKRMTLSSSLFLPSANKYKCEFTGE